MVGMHGIAQLGARIHRELAKPIRSHYSRNKFQPFVCMTEE